MTFWNALGTEVTVLLSHSHELVCRNTYVVIINVL